MAKKPDERYQKPGDLADDIDRYLKGQRVTATAPRPGVRLRKWLRLHRIAAIAVAIAIPLALCIFAFSRPDAEASETHAAALVSSTANDGPGSLRDLIAKAEPRSSITFSPDLNGATIYLDGEPLVIDKNIRIDASLLAEGITIDGGGKSRVFTITEVPAGVRFDGLTLTGGGAGVGDGGAIHTKARLTLESCQLHNNRAQNGGAIATIGDGRLFIVESTFTENIASGNGGALSHRGRLNSDIRNSTFLRNQAAGGDDLVGIMHLVDCTFDEPESTK